MSTLDPSDVPCLPCQQGYDKAHVCDIPDYCPCDQRGKHSAGDLMSVYDFSTVLRIKVVPADSIVLDPEDEDVQTLMRGGLEVAELHTAALSLVHKIRAQITPPEPPMEEPTEWGAKVTDDRGDWVLARVDGRAMPWTCVNGDQADWNHMVNPRPYEA